MASIPEAFLAAAAQYADKPAVIDGERVMTYREFAGAALKAAAALDARGEAERVAILLPTSSAFAIAFFGAQLSGRVPVPLNFFLSGEELAHIAADSGIRTVITTKYFEELAGALGVETVLAEEFIPRALEMAPGKPAKANDTATILYTSGTTGVPKGVVLSQKNVAANAMACVEHFKFLPEHVLLGVLPFFHTFALTTTLVLPAMIGATTVLAARFEPGGVLAAISRHKVTTMVAVPSMYRALVRTLDRAEADLSSLELPISGGEPLGEELFDAYRDKYGITIYEGYGLTETSPVIAANTPDAMKPHTVGRALANLEVRVADERGEDAGINVDGEIWVRGDSVMKGYLNLPEETRTAITGNAFLRTGDVGRMDEEGYIRITGRIKEMIISAGENIFPREIELVLAKHPAVAESAVIGIKDQMRGEAPKAFVVLKPGASATGEELKEFCRRHIAKYKAPAEVEFRDEFPHGPTGKILKQRLVKSKAGREGGR